MAIGQPRKGKTQSGTGASGGEKGDADMGW